jgi:uncharacterized protein (UPF0332 family)
MFDWNSYTKLAKSLVKYTKRSTISEAYFRSAASRAYYASFHMAEEYATKKLRYRPTKFNAHSTLIQFFKRNPDITLKTIGTELDSCRKDRNTSDYDTAANVDNRFTNNVFIKTDYINNTIMSLP